jgi:hypothetical protein
VRRRINAKERLGKGVALLLCLLIAFPFPAFAQEVQSTENQAKTITATKTQKIKRHKRTKVNVVDNSKKSNKNDSTSKVIRVVDLEGDTLQFSSLDSVKNLTGVEILGNPDSLFAPNLGRVRVFNPDPVRALWMSALFPGLGQVYNRRYWKLPIVIGTFVGLAYGMSWNNRMLNDYTKGYRDAMDNDPDTKSYMNFYPPTVKESDLDMAWLKKALKSKKDYYRRYRDICIISMVGVYMLCVLDAYVDASLAHFDVSPDLSMRVKPAVFTQNLKKLPSLGMRCSIDF